MTLLGVADECVCTMLARSFGQAIPCLDVSLLSFCCRSIVHSVGIEAGRGRGGGGGGGSMNFFKD